MRDVGVARDGDGRKEEEGMKGHSKDEGGLVVHGEVEDLGEGSEEEREGEEGDGDYLVLLI